MKNIKFNTQICTTIEQSKRLLELGLKPQTSDCYYYAIQYFDDVCYENTGKMAIGLRINTDNEGHFDYLLESFGLDDMDCFIPAWSLHRLMEMLPESVWFNGSCHALEISYVTLCYIDYDNKSVAGNFADFNGISSIYDAIINCIEWLIKDGHFNKKYLKEK